MAGQPGHNTRPHALLPTSFLGMDAWMTSQMKVACIHKLRGSSTCLAYSFDMLSMAVYTTRHWQTSGRSVQQLNVCTVLQEVCYHTFFASGNYTFTGRYTEC